MAIIAVNGVLKSWVKFLLCGFLLIAYTSPVWSQNYNFTNYDISNGLAQSQVLVAYQDNNHYMWFGTFGGLSRFDGKEFRSYTKADGLLNNVVSSIFRDRSGRVWFGTEAGLSVLVDNKIRTYRIPLNDDKTWIRGITDDRQGNIWFTKKSRLYKIENSRIREQKITGKNEYVVSLNKSNDGRLYAAVCGSGIYTLDKTGWSQVVSIRDSILVTKIVSDPLKPGGLYLLSPGRVYRTQDQGIIPVDHSLLNKVREPYLAMDLDSQGTLWVGTNNGAYYLHPSNPVHFQSSNGFTNNAINAIHRDLEDNMWFATDGAGVFKFDGNSFKRFTQPIDGGHIVMSIAKDQTGKLWLGGFNSGIMTYDGKQFSAHNIPSDNPSSRSIMSLFSDGTGMLIGSQNGLWRFSGKGFEHLTENQNPQSVRALIKDNEGIVWMAAPGGCFYLDERGKSNKVAGIQQSGTSLALLGKDSVLLGTNNGVQLIREKKSDTGFYIGSLKNTSVLCLLKYRDKVLVGTFGDGLFMVDIKSKKAVKYNVKDGLLSNDIYSLGIDNEGIIWAGTGRGVNRISADVKSNRLIVMEGFSPRALIECNQNSMFLDGNSMWIGSTKGLYVYNTELSKTANKKPFINIQIFKIFNQEIIDGNPQPAKIFPEGIPRDLKLNSHQNRIFISFRGIYLSDPDNVYYQYRLLGSSDEFSQPVKTNSIEYSSLLPGSYTFQVKALVGNRESQLLSIPFIISPPYYQTVWFKIFMFILLIVGIVGAQAYFTYLKNRKKLLLEEIKQQEQLKIRRQTAEDFHDDIGNKLTRISILSEILNKKIGHENQEQKVLLQQIKDNASTLYTGTKEILWALDPQSDNLFEILDHIRQSGAEVFENTGVKFSFGSIDDRFRKVQLPMEYSRNVSMILKEILSNILKHAQAENVTVNTFPKPGGLLIEVEDDGVGFDVSASYQGHGMKNIMRRAKRIRSSVVFDSKHNRGTLASISISLDQLQF